MAIYRFESCALDDDRRELRRGIDLVDLEPQVFDVLLHLVRNRHRVVSKDDLLAAVWAGRIVTESTLSSRITAVRHAIGDDGEQQRLVKTVRSKGYRFVGSVRPGEMPGSSAPRIAMGDRRPTVAVLAFANLSPANPMCGSFVDGVAEDVTTALSRLSWLRVVTCSPDAAYVLEGSARKTTEGLRVTARLVDAARGAYLWANNFDVREDIDASDRISATLVGDVASTLAQDQINRIERAPPHGPDAYHWYLSGMRSAFRWTEDGMGDALQLFHKAVEHDPGFAPAYAMAAYCHVQRKSYGWYSDRAGEIAACKHLVAKAVESGAQDPVTLARAAHATAYVIGDLDGAATLVDRARQLNPTLSCVWYVSGWLKLFFGLPAMEDLVNALRLNPNDPLAFKAHAGICYAHLLAGRYADADVAAAHAMRLRPNYLTAMRGAAASRVNAGRLGDARTLMGRMRQLDPTFRVSQLKELFPFQRACDLDRLAEGLQRAGLPD